MNEENIERTNNVQTKERKRTNFVKLANYRTGKLVNRIRSIGKGGKCFFKIKEKESKYCDR